MKYIIGCSFSIFFFIFILNEYLQNNVYFFECYIKKCIIFFSLAMIRFYSECEMCFIKTKKSVYIIYKNVLQSNPKFNEIVSKFFPKREINDVEFILDNNLVFSTTKDKLIKCRLKDEKYIEKMNFNFIIYTEINNDSNDTPIIYKKIIKEKSIKEKSNDFKEEDLICEPTDYKFILTEILVGDKIIRVNFTDKKHNYFVVGNTFNEEFINYYLNNHYQNELLDISFDDLHDFKIRVLNQDVKEETFTNKRILILNKNNYTITITE